MNRENEKILIRIASVDDTEELVRLRILMQLEVNSIAVDKVTIDYEKQLKKYFFEAISTNEYYCAIAICKNDIVATAGVCFYKKPPSILGGSGLVGYVTNVYTEKKFRRFGISSKLIQKLNSFALDLRADKLHLGATDAGVGIYTSNGYTTPRFLNLEIKNPFNINTDT